MAILVQSFRRSISVPEQYLDDLRQHSPETRIVVFRRRITALRSARKRRNVDCSHSKEADLAKRQWEMFQRADVVAVSSEDDVATLRKSRPDLRSTVIGTTVRTVRPGERCGNDSFFDP